MTSMPSMRRSKLALSVALVPAFERMLSTSAWRGEDVSREGTLRGGGMRVEVPCAHRAKL